MAYLWKLSFQALRISEVRKVSEIDSTEGHTDAGHVHGYVHGHAPVLTGCPPARVAVEAEQRVREALAGHYAAEWREQRPALRTGLRRGLRGLPRAPRGR